MTALALTPVVLSFVLLAAHFSRHDMPIVSVLCLAVPLLLFLKERWVLRLLQTLLALGAAEWLRTTFVLAADRMEAGEPWIRMVSILFAVALFTAGSAGLLQTSRLRRRYGDRQAPVRPSRTA